LQPKRLKQHSLDKPVKHPNQHQRKGDKPLVEMTLRRPTIRRPPAASRLHLRSDECLLTGFEPLLSFRPAVFEAAPYRYHQATGHGKFEELDLFYSQIPCREWSFGSD
jgi:hypothetical protein